MNSRERIVAALNHQEPDRVPIDLGGCDTGIEAGAYEPLKELLGLRGEVTTCFVRDHTEIDESVLVRFGVDTRYVRVNPPKGIKPRIQEDNSYLDLWGTRWKKLPTSLYWDMVDFPIKEPTMDALKKYPWPDPEDPWITKGIRERARKLNEETAYAVVLDSIGLGIFEQAWALRGFENFLLDLAMNEGFAEALLCRIAEYHTALFDRILTEVGAYIQVVMVADDLGTQMGPMISPETYRRLIKPAQKRVYQRIKSKTGAFIFLHSCGSVRQFIPDFIELGVDILNPVQVTAADMDPKELKAEFGQDLTFWGGGCDTQRVLGSASPDEVETEVKTRILELASGGGFVFNQVHNIQPGVPPENIVRMLETASEYGIYPIVF